MTDTDVCLLCFTHVYIRKKYLIPALNLLRLLVKHYTLELPFSPSSVQLFWNVGEVGAKKIFYRLSNS